MNYRNNAIRSMKYLVVVFLLAVLVHETHAQMNALDPSFGSNGIVLTMQNRIVGAYHSSVVVRPNGNIVVSETRVRDLNRSDFLVYQYLPNGAADPKFGTDGNVKMEFRSYEAAVPTTLLLHEDGKILVSGSISGIRFGNFLRRNIFLAQFTSDGRPDSSFGEDGLDSVSIGADGSTVVCAAINPDGKILVAAGVIMDSVTGDSLDIRLLLLRYTDQGKRDHEFGIQGMSFHSIASNGFIFRKMVTQPDGKIIVAGKARRSRLSANDLGDFCVARFTADGTLDSSFANNGVFIDPIVDTSIDAMDIAIDDDGHLLILADPMPIGVGQHGLWIYRLKSDGSLDPNFGTGGKCAYFNGEDPRPSALRLQGNHLIVGGETGIGDKRLPLFIRIDQDGSLDHTFGANGYLVQDLDDMSGDCSDIEVQADGKILNVSYIHKDGTGNKRLATMRLNNNGKSSVAPSQDKIQTALIYPNPSREIAFLQYEMPLPGKVSISLYDTRGVLVQNIVSDEYRDHGTIQESISFEKLSSGIYLLKLVREGVAQELLVRKN